VFFIEKYIKIYIFNIIYIKIIKNIDFNFFKKITVQPNPKQCHVCDNNTCKEDAEHV
jgi:hypothetical protein